VTDGEAAAAAAAASASASASLAVGFSPASSHARRASSVACPGPALPRLSLRGPSSFASVVQASSGSVVAQYPPSSSSVVVCPVCAARGRDDNEPAAEASFSFSLSPSASPRPSASRDAPPSHDARVDARHGDDASERCSSWPRHDDVWHLNVRENFTDPPRCSSCRTRPRSSLTARARGLTSNHHTSRRYGTPRSGGIAPWFDRTT
jgi:hypothetical protein